MEEKASSKRIIKTVQQKFQLDQTAVAVQSLNDQQDLDVLKKQQELFQQDKRFEAEMEQREMDRGLKKKIATQVFSFLAIETAALFFIIMLQGLRSWNFHLEDSTINIFLGATLLQISSMAVIITRHLYPTSQQ